MSTENPSRREFLKATAATACSAVLGASGLGELFAAPPTSSGLTPVPAPLAIKKGVLLDMLPAKLSYADRMKMARDVGFEVIQAPTTPDQHEAEEIKKAADGAGVRIDSVMNMDHWQYPLSSSDAAVVEKSLTGMRTSLHNAKLWGSDAVLLVPAVVNPQTSYREAWSRSQKEIRKLLPLAEELKIVIAIEEVWNKFLLSPSRNGRVHQRIQQSMDSGVVRRRECAAVRLSAGLDSRPGEEHRQSPFERFQTQRKRLRVGEPRRRRRGLAGGARRLWRNRLHRSAITELKAGDEAYLRDLSRRVDRLVLGRT